MSVNTVLNEYEQLVYRRMAEENRWLTEDDISRIVSLSLRDIDVLVGLLKLKGFVAVQIAFNGTRYWKAISGKSYDHS